MKPPMKAKLGELRQSQLMHTYGIGSIIDLPNLSAMVMGLDDWEESRCEVLEEQRLLEAVQTELGEQVRRLVCPPKPPGVVPGVFQAFEEGHTIGVPVAPFPRYLRCQMCNFLGPINSGVFELKADPVRTDKTRYVHVNCQRAQKPPPVLPARFLVACERGHLDDFPWVVFVHRGENTCRASLVLYESGASGEAVDIGVKCTTCGAYRGVAEAFGEDNRTNLPLCRGRRPHLRDFQDGGCELRMKAILLGASNSWFSVCLSVLSLPNTADPLAQLIDENWSKLQTVADPVILTYLKLQSMLPATLAAYSDVQIWEGIQKKKQGGAAPKEEEPKGLKWPEWRLLSSPDPSKNTADFRLREVASPSGYQSLVERVVLAERLREVSALIGFTRIYTPGEYTEANGNQQVRAPLSRKESTYVPGSEVRGEGIFIQLKESALQPWLARSTKRDETFREAHERWRRTRNIEPPEAGYPGLRYVLLHSLSHALMRQLSLECGYAAASIRERIYSQEPGLTGQAMSGILLYTAATDSEGTLGGLVSLGEPGSLARHINQALEQVQLCASDPLCAEHHPLLDGITLHGAACHACLFAPETSCESGNRYLDRSLLVSCVSGESWPFFEAAPQHT